MVGLKIVQCMKLTLYWSVKITWRQAVFAHSLYGIEVMSIDFGAAVTLVMTQKSWIIVHGTFFRSIYMESMDYEQLDWNQFCRCDVYCTDEYIFVQLNEFQDPVIIYKNANWLHYSSPIIQKLLLRRFTAISAFYIFRILKKIRLQIKNDQKLNACDYDWNYHGQT